MKIGFISATFASLLLAACAAPTPREPLKGHLNTESAPPAASGNIPAPVQQTLSLPKPKPTRKAETYSVVVNNVPVRDLLFALARDAKVNVDINPGITGNVTLNAIDQTLPQLLTRISKQVDMRFEMDGPNLTVMPDSPFLKHYKVDYVNMARSVTGTVSANTQIATGVPSGGAPSVGATGGNISNTRIENSSKNQFWESLEKNIKDILRETDKEIVVSRRSNSASEQATRESNARQNSNLNANAATGGGRVDVGASSAARTSADTNAQVTRDADFKDYETILAASVISNPESGIIAVRANQRQQEKIQEFIDRVINSARRQVLIEATIVEVTLNDGYQQGINWSKLTSGGSFLFTGNALTKNAVNLSYTGGDPTAAITMLNTFGTAKVLSSPRLSVMNNQTALLKVVENYIYFNVKADTTTTANVGTTTTYTTTPQSVSVGLVVSVTPQISDGDAVTLNIRPTITSVAREVADPNPSLTISNLVPVIRTREIESIMRVASGNTAVLGGLMEDRIEYQNQRVPLVGQIPIIGEVANNRNNVAKKTELVIFLRPVVIKDASVDGDYAGLKGYLPGDNFFAQPNEAQPFNIVPSR